MLQQRSFDLALLVSLRRGKLTSCDASTLLTESLQCNDLQSNQLRANQKGSLEDPWDSLAACLNAFSNLCAVSPLSKLSVSLLVISA